MIRIVVFGFLQKETLRYELISEKISGSTSRRGGKVIQGREGSQSRGH